MIKWKESAKLNNTTVKKLQLYFEKYPGSGKKIIVICDKCGKVREIYKHRYCDLCKSCASSKPKVILICKQCGNEYKQFQSLKNRSNFCSYKCQYKWSSENIIGKNNPMWNGGEVNKICEICSKKFDSRPSTNQKFCSKKCSNKSHSKNMIKENNSNWNSNLTDKERQLKRNYLEYTKWRKGVYKRDNYTCQQCGQVGGNLNAHHIESYANNPDLRTTLENGITLCKDCHDNFHHIYGYSCTRSQYNEWNL